MSVLVSGVAVVVMIASLFLIPLGLPGLWIIVAITAALGLAGSLSWAFGLIGASAAIAAELAELAVLGAFGRRFGGSRRAFWGAVAGGVVGLFIGAPIPVVGSVVAAFLGTFGGAGLVTFFETRSFARAANVGWGLVLARTAAVGLKVGTAVFLVGAVTVALWLGR